MTTVVVGETLCGTCLDPLCSLGLPFPLAGLVLKMVGAVSGLLLCSNRRSFNISFGSSSWFAHSSRGHRPVPKCQAPSGRLGILSSEFRHSGLPQHAWLPDAFILTSQCSSFLTLLSLASPEATRHL